MQFTLLFTISQHRWPHIAVIDYFFLQKELLSRKENTCCPLVSYSHLLPFRFALSQRKYWSIFNLLHGFGCDQKFEFIVGREYNYAYFQLLSFSLFQRGTVAYLCCGSKKLNKVNITPTCWRLWSPSLWVSNSFLWSVSSSLKCTWPFFKKLSWEAEHFGVFNKQTHWTPCSCFYELEFFGVNMSESWNSSPSQVLESALVTIFCSKCHHCMHAMPHAKLLHH